MIETLDIIRINKENNNENNDKKGIYEVKQACKNSNLVLMGINEIVNVQVLLVI